MADSKRTLAEHAAYELTKAGLTTNEDAEARKVATDVMALVKRFEKQNHTEKSAEYTLRAFDLLCNFMPLSPITDDPSEWDKFEIERKNVETGEVEKRTVWQSKRASAVFSEDEGKTFIDQKTGKTGESVNHIEFEKQIAQQEADRKARKEAAAARAVNPNPVGTVNPDVPAGEAVAEAPVKGTDPTPEATPEKEEAKGSDEATKETK